MTRREINAVSIVRIAFFLRHLPLPYVITKSMNIYLTPSSASDQAQGVEWRFVPDGMTEDGAGLRQWEVNNHIVTGLSPSGP